jgi:hypothetical protein
MSEAQAEAAAEPEPVSDSGSDSVSVLSDVLSDSASVVSDSELDAPAEPLAADADVAPGAAGEPAAEAEASEPEHPRVLLSGALSTVAQFAVQAGKQGRISAAKHHWAQGNETDSPAPGPASDPRFAMYCLNMWKVRQHFVDKQERTRKIWGLVSYLTFYAIWVYFVMKVPLGLGRSVALRCRSSTFIPGLLIHSVPLFLKRQCDRPLGPSTRGHA